MRTIIFGLLLVILLFPDMARKSKAQEQVTFPQREFRGVWIATVNNIDWPSRKGLPVQEQQQELIKLFDLCTALNLNAVIFQVRPAGDAFYASKLEPWSVWLTGEQGKAPDPYYDPLEFAVAECHKRGLELHAWFNPYRAGFTSQASFASNHISKTHPEYVHRYGQNYWMDPGEPEIKQHTVNVILDVVRRYDIDGVHFDDYFYPYAVPGEAFPDSNSYSKYTSAGGKLKLDDWRRENVNSMVQQVYLGILKEKPWVKFGISPFGIWQPGYPPGITGLNAYATLYADSRKWLQEGWVDYFTPQLYWRIDSPGQSYPKLLEWWLQQNIRARHIYAGNILGGGGSRAASSTATTAANREIVNQVKITREQKALGNIFFSIKGLVRNRGKIQEVFQQEIYPQKALVPAMEWKRNYYPEQPAQVTAVSKGNTIMQLEWKPVRSARDDRALWRWAIYRQIGTANWELIAILPASLTSFADTLPSDIKIADIRYAITAVDRVSNESKPTITSVSK
ncbi:MAG: family 10 glycosylhydrolase [bacterium]|nr:family 10 glycosylhydrolase [bacterium]